MKRDFCNSAAADAIFAENDKVFPNPESASDYPAAAEGTSRLVSGIAGAVLDNALSMVVAFGAWAVRAGRRALVFEQLKTIVDLIRSGLADIGKFKSGRERKEAVLGLLKTYFLLKDCIDEGEALIAEAGSDPLATIRMMEEWKAHATLERWDKVIVRQGLRLRTLQGYIYGQDHLAVINPALQDQIGEVIGYKLDRGVTLHGIGAALLFRAALPVATTREERVAYVAVMAGAEGDTLDMDRVKREIASLRDSLDRYRALVERLVTNDELLRLSREARQNTLFGSG